MDTPIQNPAYSAAVDAPTRQIPLPPGADEAPAPPGAAAETPFDLGKAMRYSVANFGASNFYMLFNTAMPLYLDSYAVRPEWIGLLANERSFVGALVQPVVGRVSDRTRTPLGRRRPFFLIGIPLCSLALMLLAIHPPFWVMIGVMTVAAFFLAVAVDPFLAMMADIWPVEQRGRVGGLLGLFNALGAITFSLMAAFLWGQQEFLVFMVVIVLMLATWAFTFFTVKEPPLPPPVEPAPAGVQLRPSDYVRELLRHGEAAKYTLAMMFFWMGNGGATPYVTLFGKHALGADDSQTFLLPLAYIVVTAICAVPAGLLADRIGKKPVITVALLIYGIGAIVGSQSPNLLVATLVLGVIGMGNTCVGLLVPMLTDLVPRRRTAELVGIFSAATSFTQPLGSFLAGLVVDVVARMAGLSIGYRWSFIFAGVAILIGAAILQTVHPKRAVTAEE